MKRFVLLLLLALWLLSSSSFADQVVVPSAEVLPVFDAKYGRKLIKAAVDDRRNLGGEAGIDPKDLDMEKLSQLRQVIVTPIDPTVSVTYSDKTGPKIRMCLGIYNSFGKTYLEAFSKVINRLFAENIYYRYRLIRNNVNWFKKKGPDYERLFDEFDAAYYAGDKYMEWKAQETINRYKMLHLKHPGDDLKGVDFIYMSKVIERKGLDQFFGLTGLKPSFKNKLHDLDKHINYALKDLEALEKDNMSVMKEIEKVMSLHAEVWGRIRTDPDYTEEINPLFDQDDAVLQNLHRLCWGVQEYVDYFKKDEKAVRLLKNDPPVAKYAIGVKLHRGDGPPNYEKGAAEAFTWMNKYQEQLNSKIDRELR